MSLRKNACGVPYVSDSAQTYEAQVIRLSRGCDTRVLRCQQTLTVVVSQPNSAPMHACEYSSESLSHPS
jgi:hypothetical protein